MPIIYLKLSHYFSVCFHLVIWSVVQKTTFDMGLKKQDRLLYLLIPAYISEEALAEELHSAKTSLKPALSTSLYSQLGNSMQSWDIITSRDYNDYLLNSHL